MSKMMMDVRDENGDPITGEEAERLAELHNECSRELKEKMLELTDKFPSEYRVAALNAMSVELAASALDADVRAIERHADDGDKADADKHNEAMTMGKAVFEMVGNGIMPLFAKLGTLISDDRVKVVEDEEEARRIMGRARRSSSRDENTFTAH